MPPAAPETAPIEKLWTVPEFARATGVSATTWHRRIKDGEITVVDLGRTSSEPRIPDSVARAWIAAHTILARRTA